MNAIERLTLQHVREVWDRESRSFFGELKVAWQLLEYPHIVACLGEHDENDVLDLMQGRRLTEDEFPSEVLISCRTLPVLP